jgi:hypothetical protein
MKQTKYILERMTILGSTTDIMQQLKWRLEIFKQSTLKEALGE